MTTPDHAQPPIGLEVVAALLVPSACYGFVRVFEEATSVLPLIGAALLSSAAAVALRRSRVPLFPAVVISIAALFVLIANRYAPGTSRLGIIPTRQTLDGLQALADDGFLQFRELRSPVEATDPFIAASMGGAWLMAFLTDWGALRLRLAFEPVLPAGLLFIFSGVLGAGNRQLTATMVFVAAVVLWSITQRTYTLAQRGVWLTVDRRRGPAGLARSGLAVAAVAVLLGVVIGPRLPGADAEELYSWRNQGDPTRVVVSPYANIGSRLVTQQDVTLFTVEASQPAYWRLAGLDTYNGEDGIWQTKGQFQPEDGGLPGTRARAGTTVTVEQTFHIEALAEIWLPAAFAPATLVESDVQATWNADEAALTVSRAYNDSDGVNYTVESVVPLFTPDELNSASPLIPTAIGERYLGLPDDLNPRILSEALEITSGTTTRYEQMLALQDHFQTFDYSIRLGPRGDDPIDTFLNEQVGFCQQFSGTFALMARALGAPSRVAVGFTWGDPIGDGVYEVTGRHTHAWPEVWFEGLGWVAFEPTPGRGAPNNTHTNIPARQDSPVEPGDPDLSGPSQNPGTLPAPQIEDFVPEFGGGLEEPAPADLESGFSVPWRFLGFVALIGAYVLGMLGFQRLRRARRRQNATTPIARVEAAWADATDDLEKGFELVRKPSETRREFANRAARDRRVPEDAIDILGRTVTEARFRATQPGSGMTEEHAVAAEQASRAIVERIKERVPVRTRIARDIDPRRLFSPHLSHRGLQRRDRLV